MMRYGLGNAVDEVKRSTGPSLALILWMLHIPQSSLLWWGMGKGGNSL